MRIRCLSCSESYEAETAGVACPGCGHQPGTRLNPERRRRIPESDDDGSFDESPEDTESCRGCGARLEPGWTVCPMCCREIAAQSPPPATGAEYFSAVDRRMSIAGILLMLTGLLLIAISVMMALRGRSGDFLTEIVIFVPLAGAMLFFGYRMVQRYGSPFGKHAAKGIAAGASGILLTAGLAAAVAVMLFVAAAIALFALCTQLLGG